MIGNGNIKLRSCAMITTWINGFPVVLFGVRAHIKRQHGGPYAA